MSGTESTYFCIDMKCFYASVECAERGLNPFETDLVVADPDRGRNALCLAISPKMKARGIRNRCRLSEIPEAVDYLVAKPRMQLYIEYAADIYALYLNWFDPRDIHVYSIDEAFIDATAYLKSYGMTPKALAKRLMDEIAVTLHIPSTAGIGTNLFLAKIALDITAKHAKDHMGILDEESFRATLWDHRPITDFWQIAAGKARRLERCGILTLRDITAAPPELLYKLFGVDAELLIDHAWGRESCRISDIKSYRGQTRSVSFSQILPSDYPTDRARVVLTEMVLQGCQELMRRGLIAAKLWVGVGYAGERHESTHGSLRLASATALDSLVRPQALALFDRIVLPEYPVRRLGIAFGDAVDEACEGYDLFTDRTEIEREKAKEKAVLEIMDRHGKNAILRGTSFLEGATQRERNGMIGGHRAGYDDPSAKSQTVSPLRRDEGPAGGPAGSGGTA